MIDRAALEAVLPALYSTENVPNNKKIVPIHITHTTLGWHWFPIEGGAEGDDFVMFGLVIGLDVEFGYFSLNELNTVDATMDAAWHNGRYITAQEILDAVGE
jgi:hypothetical protein